MQGSNKYRFGFNGKEKDNEVKGEGNQQDYGMRIYDPRLGRFLSVDPVGNEFPWNSMYAFAGNDPINFIDLDGLEKSEANGPGPKQGRTGRQGGKGRVVTGLRSQAEAMAEQLGRDLMRAKAIQRRADNIRHERLMRTNPAYANSFNSGMSLVNSFNRESYISRAFNTAGTVFGGGNGVRDNHKAGEKWDDFVHATMMQNPNYIGVARQISLKVTGTINGQTIVANIRVDNVGISKDASGKILFNLVEAKYSINDITINNVKQTLTPQQKLTEYILLNGKDVHFYVRGTGSASVLSQSSASSGTAFQKDQDITGNISQITVVVPTTNSSASTTTTPKKNTTPPKTPSQQNNNP